MLKALDLYSKMKLKDQKGSLSDLQKGMADYPPYRLKCTRWDFQTKEINELLQAVTNKQIPLQEVETEETNH